MEYYDINKLLHAAHFKNFNKIKSHNQLFGY